MKAPRKALHDEDLAKVGAALRRAAKQARKTAERTHTPLVIYEGGRVIRKRIEEGKGYESQSKRGRPF